MNMNILKMMRKTILVGTGVLVMTVTSCNPEPDESDLYTFTGETIESMIAQDSSLTAFNYILSRVGYDKMMAAYGNYTCFVPTNDGVAAYCDSLYNDSEAIIPHNGMTENSLKGLSDSLCLNIVQYHITPTYRDIVSMTGNGEVSTLLGYEFSFSSDSGETLLGNKATIIPVANWKDYEGEQLQVITPFGMTLLLSSFNSKLVYDENSIMKAYDFAKMYVGKDGEVVDLSESVDKTSFNYDIIDTEYNFNKVMILKDKTATIMSIDKWTDYEGEQLQMYINNGPELLTAAYEAVLINDQNSEIKASYIASFLSDNVTDLSNDESKGIFNKQIIDLDYGFSTSIISNDNSESTVKITQWNDYDGEQLQIILDTGDTILGTSMTLSLLNNGTTDLNTSVIAKYYAGDNGKCIDEVNNEILLSGFNKTLIDIGNNSFKYALKLNDGNVTIIPLQSWKDYENSSRSERYIDSDGNVRTRTVKGDPNCEQLKLFLPDDTVLLTTAYNTILVNNESDIKDIAELFRGKDGVIIDLTDRLGEPNNSSWNKIFFDTRYSFDSAIISNGDKNIVVDVYTWHDYVDGEQVQITFDDMTDILTSYYNTTLVSSGSDGIVELLSNAFKGIESNGKTK